jgi:hypothetical protein
MPFRNVGMGDPVARIDVGLLQHEPSGARLAAVGAMKAPLADVGRGYGTGEWDIGAGLSGSAAIWGTSIIGDAVYWRIGNPPGASLRNALAYSLVLGRPVGRTRWSILGTIAGATSLWTGLDGPAQMGAGVGFVLESGASLFSAAAVGLTRTAPTISTSLGWRLPLGARR